VAFDEVPRIAKGGLKLLLQVVKGGLNPIIVAFRAFALAFGRTDLVVEFPAVRLLTNTPVEQQRRKRLRELILLALRVTALVLLAGAFARPYLAGRVLAADAAVTVVAVDRSFSLSAPTVFERARRWPPRRSATPASMLSRSSFSTTWLTW
jgi:hypothetical protein